MTALIKWNSGLHFTNPNTGRFERTLQGSFILGAAKKHFEFSVTPCGVHGGFLNLRKPLGLILRPYFAIEGVLKNLLLLIT